MEQTEPTRIAFLTERLLACTEALGNILDHMLRAPGVADFDAVIEEAAGLLVEVLAPLAAQHSPAELEAAARVLEAVTETLIREVVLVPHPTERLH